MDAVPGIIAGTHGPGAMSSRRLPLWAGWLLALAVAAACASLGAWQLQRMHAKQAQVDAAAQVLADRRADPLSAAADPASARGYRWSAGEGAFLPLPAVLLDNQNRGGRAGVHAYRVFQPRAEHATPLLVDALADAGVLDGATAEALCEAHAQLVAAGLDCTLDRRARIVPPDARLESARESIRAAWRAHGLAAPPATV